ncbi:hypothetical protein ANO11243_018260 [Dothideomycetidae sp. 11243]|nr:hypothetical protein ANO11243_018260 [fungal sp. No.11243]
MTELLRGAAIWAGDLSWRSADQKGEGKQVANAERDSHSLMAMLDPGNRGQRRVIEARFTVAARSDLQLGRRTCPRKALATRCKTAKIAAEASRDKLRPLGLIGSHRAGSPD